MAKKTMPMPVMGKPNGKSKYEEEDDDEEECGCEGHEEGIMLQISILLPESLQPKGRK